MSEIVDLDALTPPEVTIKFGGSEIKVQPPKTGDVLKIGNLAQKIQNVDTLTDAEIDKATDDLVAIVKKVIPELAPNDLNTAQILKLVTIISEMALPADAKELNARGITVGKGDPKVPASA